MARKKISLGKSLLRGFQLTLVAGVALVAWQTDWFAVWRGVDTASSRVAGMVPPETRNAAKATVNVISDLARPVSQPVSDAAREVYHAASNKAGEAGRAVSDGARSAYGAASTAANSGLDMAGSVVNNAASSARSAAQSVSGAARESFAGVPAAVREIAQSNAPPSDLVAFHWPFGVPRQTNFPFAIKILPSPGHVSGYCPELYQPAWVASQFANVPSEQAEARPDSFSPDPRVSPPWQVSPAEYTGSGYDRGHMSPNAAVSRQYGRQAQLETFYMTNIIPQSPELNRGLWASLEKIIANDYSRRFKRVWVITGPVFSPGSNFGATAPCLPRSPSRVRTPEGCYKIVARLDDNGGLTLLAFVMPNAIGRESHDQRLLAGYLKSLGEVESLTGLDFFPSLPEKTKADLRALRPAKLW